MTKLIGDICGIRVVIVPILARQYFINLEIVCESTKTHRQASPSIAVAQNESWLFFQSPNHHHHFPSPGGTGKAGTCRKLEFTGFALSNTAGGKGRGTLQRHTMYRSRDALQRRQAGTKLFWCHIFEHSAALWVEQKQAHCYTLNMVTLSHFGGVFGDGSAFEGTQRHNTHKHNRCKHRAHRHN